jgi:hypothetical protein
MPLKRPDSVNKYPPGAAFWMDPSLRSTFQRGDSGAKLV